MAFLRAIERDDWTHLADYALVRTTDTGLLLRADGSAVDLESHQGQHAFGRPIGLNEERVRMESVLAPFESASGRSVPAFLEPRPGIRIDRDVLAGFPSITGTRIPYDAVASLVADGAAFPIVHALYPTVPEVALASAADFAGLVAAA